ncbi:hypothetical protein [Pseudomonas fluorescens]
MRPAVINNTSFVDRTILDKQERADIALALNSAVLRSNPEFTAGQYSATASLPNTARLSLQNLFIPYVAGSTLDDVYEPARNALQRIIETEEFSSLCKAHGFPANARIGVDDKANVFGVFKHTRHELPIEGDDQTAMLAEFAKLTGGYVYSGYVIGIEQWLAFEGLSLPQTIGDIKQLIAYLNFELPAPPACGDYHELLNSDADSPFHLSRAKREIITQVIQEATQGKTTLLQQLSRADFNRGSAADKRKHADSILDDCLGHGIASDLGRKLHERLDWHLEPDDQQVRANQLREMLMAALIIDIEARTNQPILTRYDLYQPANATLHAAQVRENLEQHLVTEGLIEPDCAPLAAHLFLAGAAAEFLIPDIPAELTLEKPGWVVIVQSVALIEYASPGSSRLMTYAQIKAFADLAPRSPEQIEQHETAGFAPTINWAVLNGVIDYRANRDYDKLALVKATSYFSRYMEALSQSETGLSRAPPDRRKTALEALHKVMPEGSYIEKKAFSLKYLNSFKDRSWLESLKAAHPVGILSEFYDVLLSVTDNSEYSINKLLRLRFSILDLYLSGDLVKDGKLTDNFQRQSHFNPPATAFERLSDLGSPEVLFNQAFENYYQDVREGMSSVIKMAISNMPERDRHALTHGHLTLYTVRTEVNPLNPQEETQFARDEAKGRYGIILCCKNGNALRTYEFFTLRGLCRERSDLVDLLQSRQIIDARPTLSYTGSQYDFQTKNQAQDWPLDFAAYREGSEPRNGVTSCVVVEKLWHLNPDVTDIRPVSLFFSRQVNDIAECILTNHPVASHAELYASLNVQTELEEWRSTKETIERLAINVIVPFKQCIEDIRSGRTDRVSEGIGGCVLDGLSVIGLLIGLGSTVAGIVAKTGSTTLKVLSISRAVARVAVSLINPLDGLPTLARKGLRLAGRGLLFVGENGLSAARTANAQLRKLINGAQAHDLIKVERLTDIRQATWCGADGAGQVIDIAVLERYKRWHALNLKVGGAWGPRLKFLNMGNLSPLKRLFVRSKPFSYTRGYLTKAIPHAKSKLDNTIDMLTNIREDDYQVRSLLKHVFGTDSNEAIEYITNNLRSMRKDLDFVDVTNMVFRPHEPKVLAALRVDTYKNWKAGIVAGVKVDKPAGQFLAIYPDNLDEFYQVSKYDDGSIGDVLVHEMSHGAPGTLDLYYGEVLAGVTPAEFDAVGLLEFARDAHKANPENLSNPHFRFAKRKEYQEFKRIKDELPTVVQDHPPLLNAESYALAVSLLDQQRTAPAAFQFNLSTMEHALKHTAPGDFIQGPLLLNLAKPI